MSDATSNPKAAPTPRNVTIRRRRPASTSSAAPSAPAPLAGAGGAGEPPKPPYETGYKRPPEEYKFRKGKSGNPRGRPRGAKGFKGQLRKVLAEPMQVKINGRTVYKSRQEIICLSLADKAARGDMKAIALLIQLDPVAHEMLAKSASAAVEEVLDAEDDAMVLEYLRTLKGGADDQEGEP